MNLWLFLTEDLYVCRTLLPVLLCLLQLVIYKYNKSSFQIAPYYNKLGKFINEANDNKLFNYLVDI